MKFRNFVAIILISMITTVIVNTVMNNLDPDLDMDQLGFETETPVPEDTEAPSDQNGKLFDEIATYMTYYDQLTDYQKNIYDVVLDPISKGVKKFKITNIKDLDVFEENFFKVTLAIQYDHPEYFWFKAGYSYVPHYDSLFSKSGSVTFSPPYYSYTNYGFDPEEAYATLMDKVKEVADLAKSHSSDPYQQITYVHDYLIVNSYYDHDALAEFEQTVHGSDCEYIFSAYGCLINGKTVCSGYAKAFQLILTELGYKCNYVVGDAGGPHGWNCVYIDGEGYYVDVTWDDMDLKKEIPTYDYMCITGSTLSQDHTVSTEHFALTICTATEFNYFSYYNCYFDQYSFEAVSPVIEDCMASGTVYLKFSSPEELEKAVNELVGSDPRILDISDDFRKWRYTTIGNRCTLIIHNY